MDMSWLRNILKGPMDWFGEIKVTRSFPFIVFSIAKNKVKADEMRDIMAIVHPGDLVLRRQEKNLATQIIPGFFSHVGVMEDYTKIIHAVGEGVISEDILDYLVTDYVLVLRFFGEDAEKMRENAVELARSCIGKPYDYIFDSDNKDALYCTEAVMFSYPEVIPKRMRKRDKVPPDDLQNVSGFTTMFDSKLWRNSRI